MTVEKRNSRGDTAKDPRTFEKERAACPSAPRKMEVDRGSCAPSPIVSLDSNGQTVFE